MISFQSVKFRLTLWYAFILTFLLSVFAFVMYAELARALYHDVDKSLFSEAISLEESLEGYIKDIPIGAVPVPPIALEKRILYPGKALVHVLPLLPTDIKNKLNQNIESWEKNNPRLAQSPLMLRFLGLNRQAILSNLTGWERRVIFPDFERDSTFMEKGDSFQTIHYQKRPIRLYYRLVRFKSRPLFMIQSGASLREVESTLGRLAWIIWLSIPVAVAVACVAGWLFVKRSFLPIDLMIREARQITAAYLKGRLPRSQAGDELDRLAETLNEMMDRIESSTRAVQDFSSDISHELRTPLAIIRGEIDLALRRARSPEALMETLRVIGGEVNELIRLVDDLILLVRSDAKQLRFEKKKVSLLPLLQQISERFQDRVQAKDIVFRQAYHHEVVIEGDEVYLKRLFSNLLDNAIKFTPAGGRVDLDFRKDQGGAIVQITDTGIGIELEMQPKVFSRFYRTDQARSHDGAGLGLNIAKTICDAHGAAIHIESAPGQGTSVTVKFPLS